MIAMRIRSSHIALATTLAALAGCGRGPQAEAALQPPSVPDALRAPANETVVAKASAQGTQIYECQAGDGGFAWKLVGPDAVLTDSTGSRIGRHYAGPTWEALDGSKVVGALAQKVDAPGGGAIPWLLLSAKSTEGTGKFANVTSIQRVDTEGGVAPAGGCDATKAGTRQSIAYRAKYYFYAKSS
jgi:hypothetical protein